MRRSALLTVALVLACEGSRQRATTNAEPPPAASQAPSPAPTIEPPPPVGFTPAPVPNVEPGAGPDDARVVLESYLKRSHFLAPPDTVALAEPPCNETDPVGTDPMAYVGFVDAEIIGLAVRADPTGDRASGVVAVTRVVSAVVSPYQAARLVVKPDTVVFLMKQSPAASDSSRRWMVCYDTSRERALTWSKAVRELPDLRLEPAGGHWETAYVAADSIRAMRAGRRWRRNPPPPVPFVVRDICPGEGCSFGQWLACATHRVQAADSARAPLAFTLQRNESFTALTANLHVKRPGIVVFRDTVSPAEAGYNRTFTPADTLFPLYYIGEGFIRWFLHGREEEGEVFFPYPTSGSVSSDGRIVLIRPEGDEWWVRVRNSKGQEGWLGPDRPSGGIVGIAPHYEDSPLKCTQEPDR